MFTLRHILRLMVLVGLGILASGPVLLVGAYPWPLQAQAAADARIIPPDFIRKPLASFRVISAPASIPLPPVTPAPALPFEEEPRTLRMEMFPGELSLFVPVGWATHEMGQAGYWIFILGSSEEAAQRVLNGEDQLPRTIVGIVAYYPPEVLPRFNVKPTDSLETLFDAFVDQYGPSYARTPTTPDDELFDLNGRQAHAQVRMCADWVDIQTYFVLVKIPTGYAFASFDLKGLTMSDYRETLRLIAISTDFTPDEPEPDDG